MNWLAVILLVIAALALSFLAMVFGANVVAWNVNDIAAKGANFWNVFWILLVAVILVGGSSKAAH